MKFLMFTAAAALVGLTVSAIDTAEAGRRAPVPEGNFVIAESEFGNGRIVAPVRRTRLGPQVQLPGGSWVDCANSCAETLRVKTVDFWQSEEGMGSEGAMTQDGHLFGKLGRSWGWSR